MAGKRPSKGILWLTMLAAPVALAFETVLRMLLFPDDFELVREFLSPMLTPVAWAFGALAAIAGFVGLGLQGRMVRRRLAKLPDTASVDERYREVFAVFLLSSSVPQIPAILSTLTYMFGASLVPVLVGVAACSVGVVTQALRVPGLAGDTGAG